MWQNYREVLVRTSAILLLDCLQLRIFRAMNNSSVTCIQQLLPTTIVYSAGGGVGFLLAVTILIALFCARAYKTILQRLIIYSVLMVIAQDSCHLASIIEYPCLQNVSTAQLNDSIHCVVIGLVTNWSGWSKYIFYLVIIFYLLGVQCVQVKGAARRKKLKAWKTQLEVSIELCCVFLPGLVMWIPVVNSKYTSLSNNVCFFKTLCDPSQPKNFFWDIFFFNFFGYELVTSFCVVLAIGLFVVYCVLSSKLRLQKAKLMMKYLIFLLAAVIVNNVMQNIIMISYINFPFGHKLRFFTAIIATADDFVFLIGYLLVFYSSKVSATLRGLSKSRVIPLKDGTEYGTFRVSDRESAPSETHWSESVPFTGEFTSVTIQND